MAYEHGLITWTDLASPDVDGAKAFYCGLMGWEADDIEYEGQFAYVMFRRGGELAAGMSKQSAEMAEQRVPPMWTTYVNVASADDIAAAFAASGGEILVAPMDVMHQGRMTYGADPTGAPIGFWQPAAHHGADKFNDPGFLTWNELTTRDPQAAIDFYTAILPWTVAHMDVAGLPYYMFMLGERPVAGIITMDESGPADVPSHWMTYFRVEGTRAAVGKVAELGGEVPVPPFDTPQGTAAVINDPSGGTFSIIDPAPQP